MKMRHLLALPLLALSATAAWAQDAAMCRDGLFPTEPPFALAEVNGQDPAYFHADIDGCPWTGSACREPVYVVPGDTVIISRTRKGFACAFYPGKDGGTAGWVRTKRLNILRFEPNPALSAWLGAWSSEGNPELTFETRLGQLHVSGKAFWPGPPGTGEWPSIHEGAISGKVRVKGQSGEYGDENLCAVKFTLLGNYLVAGDNNRCGGTNVSFSAVYRRIEG